MAHERDDGDTPAATTADRTADPQLTAQEIFGLFEFARPEVRREFETVFAHVLRRT